MRKRCVALLLVLVLLGGVVLPARRAEAAAATAELIATTASVNPLAAVGVMLLAVVGLAVAQEAISSDILGSSVYDMGQSLMQSLAIDPTCTKWYGLVEDMASGGLTPGMEIEVPAEVLEATRAWVGETYDFTDGPVVTTQNGFYDADRFIGFAPYSSSDGTWFVPSSIGTLFDAVTLTFPSGCYLFTKYDIRPAFGIESTATIYSQSGKSLYSTNGFYDVELKSCLCYDGLGVRVGLYKPDSNLLAVSGRNGVSLTVLGLSLLSASGVLSQTPAFDIPLEGDQTMTVPKDATTAVVDGLTVPLFPELTQTDVLTDVGVIDPPIETSAPIDPDIPVETPTTILDALLAVWETIKAIPKAIIDGILAGIKALFVPTEAALTKVQTAIDEKLPVIADLKGLGDDFIFTLENPSQSAADLRFTTVVDLGKKSHGVSSGSAKVNLLDVSWYLEYKPWVDDIIVGLCWLVFLWNLYGQIPSIIHGGASGLYTTSVIQKELKSKRGDDE